MKTCWAASLGNCKGKISREHPVSRSVFEGDEVFVQGFPWCSDRPKKVSVANLTRKVLCQKHNSDLSDIDKAGSEARKAFGQTQRSPNEVSALPNIGGFCNVAIGGAKFERWCLKTLVSISFEGECPIGKNAIGPGQVDGEVVELAFGLRKFSPGVGLYSIGSDGEEFRCAPSIRIAPAVCDRGYIWGAIFVIHNFRFAIMLEDIGKQRIHIHEGNGKSLMAVSDVCYQPAKIGVRVGGTDWIFNFMW